MNFARATEVSERLGGRLGSELRRLDPEMVELSLHLPQWQVEALEVAARSRGLTTGQMLRRLIGNYCSTLRGGE